MPSALDLALFVAFSFLTGIGVSCGYHRYFTHRSFETSRPVKWALGILGSMALQGPLTWWVCIHRQHHFFADKEGDPHSPKDGFLHAHFGWLFPAPAARRYYVPCRDARAISRLYPLWVLLSLSIPFWVGGWSGFFWGGVIRVIWVLNVTWAVNSICHLRRRRNEETGDHSLNIPLLAPLTMGEAFHHNHHSHARNAKFGPWYLDPGWAVLCVLSKFGLVWGARV